MRSISFTLLIAAACGHPSTTKPVNNRAPVDSGDRAYIADGTGLVEVEASGHAQVVAPAGARWCSADARAHVVWFVTSGGLSAFDLEDRKVHPVIRGDLSVYKADGSGNGDLTAIIDWGKEKLGGENPVAFDVGVSLAMTETPKLAMVMGCMGFRQVYCEDDQGKPTPSVVALRARVPELAIADPAYVAQLAKRGANGSLWTPEPKPPREIGGPAVDRARCTEMPDQCGKLTVVPAQPLWLVITDNSRGDYFSESRALWDPATGEFLQLVAGKLVRTRTEPPDGGAGSDYAGLRVSPTGLSIGGAVFDATHVIYAPHDEGISCGWASGGWRIYGTE